MVLAHKQLNCGIERSLWMRVFAVGSARPTCETCEPMSWKYGRTCRKRQFQMTISHCEIAGKRRILERKSLGEFQESLRNRRRSKSAPLARMFAIMSALSSVAASGVQWSASIGKISRSSEAKTKTKGGTKWDFNLSVELPSLLASLSE